MFQKTTHGITVTAVPQFLPEESDESEGRYAWAYTISLENHGERTVQLLNRYWHITDARGLVQEVRGPGVIGQQPVLAPGGAFQYTSGTLLRAPSGIMHGAYEMVGPDGARFSVEVPAFPLDCPSQRPVMN